MYAAERKRTYRKTDIRKMQISAEFTRTIAHRSVQTKKRQRLYGAAVFCRAIYMPSSNST